jgi:hypothetical protein
VAIENTEVARRLCVLQLDEGQLDNGKLAVICLLYLCIEECVEIIDDHVSVFHCSAGILDSIDAVFWRQEKLF